MSKKEVEAAGSVTERGMSIQGSNAPIGVYRTTGFWRILGLAVSAIMVLGGIVAVIYTWTGAGADIPKNKGIFTVFAAGDVAMGFYIGASLIKGHITLYSDAIESAGVWRRYRLAKTDIACKLVTLMGALTIILIPKTKGKKKMMVSITFTRDQVFKDWMEEIPIASKATLASRSQKKPS